MKSAIKISGIYLLLAASWILISDKIILLFSPRAESLIRYSMFKGIFFVTVTSIFIFLLVFSEINRRNKLIKELNGELLLKKQLIRELHHRILNNLQIVVSLFNDNEDSDYSEKTRNRIIGRLFSMKSVFAIVYNTEDMKNIKLSDVLKEYCNYYPGKFKLIIDSLYCDRKLSVEHVVTVMIVIDIVRYLFSDNDTVAIRLKQDNTVTLNSELQSDILTVTDKDSELLAMLLRSIGSDLSIDEADNSVTVKIPAEMLS